MSISVKPMNHCSDAKYYNTGDTRRDLRCDVDKIDILPHEARNGFDGGVEIRIVSGGKAVWVSLDRRSIMEIADALNSAARVAKIGG